MNLKSQWFLYKGKYNLECADMGFKATKVNTDNDHHEGKYISWDEVVGLSLGVEVREEA